MNMQHFEIKLFSQKTFDLNCVLKGPTVDDRSHLTIKHLLPIRLVFNVLTPVSHIAQLLVLWTQDNIWFSVRKIQKKERKNQKCKKIYIYIWSQMANWGKTTTPCPKTPCRCKHTPSSNRCVYSVDLSSVSLLDLSAASSGVIDWKGSEGQM